MKSDDGHRQDCHRWLGSPSSDSERPLYPVTGQFFGNMRVISQNFFAWFVLWYIPKGQPSFDHPITFMIIKKQKIGYLGFFPLQSNVGKSFIPLRHIFLFSRLVGPFIKWVQPDVSYISYKAQKFHEYYIHFVFLVVCKKYIHQNKYTHYSNSSVMRIAQANTQRRSP